MKNTYSIFAFVLIAFNLSPMTNSSAATSKPSCALSETEPESWIGEWKSKIGKMNIYGHGGSFKIYGQEGAIEAYHLDCVINPDQAEGTLSCMGAGHTPNGAYLISSQFTLNKGGVMSEKWKMINSEVEQSASTEFKQVKSFLCKDGG